MQNPFTPSFGVSRRSWLGVTTCSHGSVKRSRTGLDHRAERPSIPARGVLEGPSFSVRSS
jgi:hypothetical protein